MLQLDAVDPMLAVTLLIILIAIYSLGRLLGAWWDSRALRREEEVNGMQWRRMR